MLTGSNISNYRKLEINDKVEDEIKRNDAQMKEWSKYVDKETICPLGSYAIIRIGFPKSSILIGILEYHQTMTLWKLSEGAKREHPELVEGKSCFAPIHQATVKCFIDEDDRFEYHYWAVPAGLLIFDYKSKDKDLIDHSKTAFDANLLRVD